MKKKDQIQAFISYSHKDKNFIKFLDRWLTENGIDTFLDIRDIKVGDLIPEKIIDGIHSSKYLIYVISSNSLKSNWVREELNIAKVKEKEDSGFKILPIIIDDVDLPNSIKHIRCADAKNWKNEKKALEALSNIIEAMGKKPLNKIAAEGDHPKPNKSNFGLWLMGAILLITATYFISRFFIPNSAKPDLNVCRLHGSYTIGAELTPKLAMAFLEKKGAANITETPTAPDEKNIRGTMNGKPQFFEIKTNGSETAFTSLSEGKCDIGCASRQAKPEEVQQLKTANIGDMTSSGSEIVIAMDGIAVIVNPNNPIDKLSMEQIAQIFGGKITDWSKINPGFSGPINIYTPADNTGTFDTFKNLVLKNVKDPATNDHYQLVTTAKRFESSEELSRQVVNDPRGIGFIGLPYILNSKAVSVYQENSIPLYPTAFTVETEDYILSRRLFFYIPANPGPGTREFVDFVLSDEGQRIVGAVGFVPLTIQLFPSHIPPDAPANYKNYVGGSKRLSINIRFKTDSSEPDNKSVRDLNRLVDFLKAPEQRNAVIVLAGFADNTGSPGHNIELSRQRAQSVLQKMAEYGIGEPQFPVLVDGFGQEVPVASNATQQGRDKNRRVEVWLRKK